MERFGEVRKNSVKKLTLGEEVGLSLSLYALALHPSPLATALGGPRSLGARGFAYRAYPLRSAHEHGA